MRGLLGSRPARLRTQQHDSQQPRPVSQVHWDDWRGCRLRAQDPGSADQLSKQGETVFDWGLFWFKGLTVGSGQCNVKAYNRQLLDL